MILLQPPTPLSTLPPPAETVAAATGAGDMAARNDHTHPRLTSTNIDTTDANGLRTITFTRTFAVEPSPVITLVEAGTTAPVSWRVQSWVMGTGPDAGKYVGAVIYGQRAQPLPALTGILLIGPLLTALASFAPWVAAGNTKFSAIMIASSQP